MTGLEIFLCIVAPAAIVGIVVLALRNRDLERTNAQLYGLSLQPRPNLPPVAQTVALPDAPMIKQANFDRAISWRDETIAEQEGLLKTFEATVQALRDEARAAVAQVKQELDVERAERMRIAGLYQTAELHRQRLEIENKRLKEANITPGDSFAAIPMRIGTH